MSSEPVRQPAQNQNSEMKKLSEDKVLKIHVNVDIKTLHKVASVPYSGSSKTDFMGIL